MKRKIKVSANSSNNILTIQLLKVPEKNCKMDIYHVSGNLIKQVKLCKQNTSVEIVSFAPGLYILILISGKKVNAVRFLKELG